MQHMTLINPSNATPDRTIRSDSSVAGLVSSGDTPDRPLAETDSFEEILSASTTKETEENGRDSAVSDEDAPSLTGPDVSLPEDAIDVLPNGRTAGDTQDTDASLPTPPTEPATDDPERSEATARAIDVPYMHVKSDTASDLAQPNLGDGRPAVQNQGAILARPAGVTERQTPDIKTVSNPSVLTVSTSATTGVTDNVTPAKSQQTPDVINLTKSETQPVLKVPGAEPLISPVQFAPVTAPVSDQVSPQALPNGRIETPQVTERSSLLPPVTNQAIPASTPAIPLPTSAPYRTTLTTSNVAPAPSVHQSSELSRTTLRQVSEAQPASTDPGLVTVKQVQPAQQGPNTIGVRAIPVATPEPNPAAPQEKVNRASRPDPESVPTSAATKTAARPDWSFARMATLATGRQSAKQPIATIAKVDSPTDRVTFDQPLQDIRPAAETTGSRPTTDTMLSRVEMPRHIAMQLAQALQSSGLGRAVELSLKPAELGHVRMTLQTTDNVVMVHINVDRPETLDLMRRHIDALAQEFKSIGYGDAEFTFSQQNQSGDQTQRASDLSEQRSDGMLSQPVSPDQPNPTPLRLISDRVDIRL